MTMGANICLTLLKMFIYIEYMLNKLSFIKTSLSAILSTLKFSKQYSLSSRRLGWGE